MGRCLPRLPPTIATCGGPPLRSPPLSCSACSTKPNGPATPASAVPTTGTATRWRTPSRASSAPTQPDATPARWSSTAAAATAPGLNRTANRIRAVRRPGWEISITHSGDRVGVALTRGLPVGLDVEGITDRDLDGLASYALTAREHAAWRALDAADRAAGFFTYWARKEALLKATGQGLAGGLTSVEVSPPDAAAALLAWHGPEAPTQVWLCDLDAGADYRAALAVVSARPVTVAVHDASVLLNQSRQMFDSGSALLPNPR